MVVGILYLVQKVDLHSMLNPHDGTQKIYLNSGGDTVLGPKSCPTQQKATNSLECVSFTQSDNFCLE